MCHKLDTTQIMQLRKSLAADLENFRIDLEIDNKHTDFEQIDRTPRVFHHDISDEKLKLLAQDARSEAIKVMLEFILGWTRELSLYGKSGRAGNPAFWPTLASIGEPVIPHLLEIITTDNEAACRCQALKALLSVSPERCWQEASKILDAKDAEVSLMALRILYKDREKNRIEVAELIKKSIDIPEIFEHVEIFAENLLLTHGISDPLINDIVKNRFAQTFERNLFENIIKAPWLCDKEVMTKSVFTTFWSAAKLSNLISFILVNDDLIDPFLNFFLELEHASGLENKVMLATMLGELYKKNKDKAISLLESLLNSRHSASRQLAADCLFSSNELIVELAQKAYDRLTHEKMKIVKEPLLRYLKRVYEHTGDKKYLSAISVSKEKTETADTIWNNISKLFQKFFSR
ncbi:MAG: hypothetical protein KKB51_10855 [Candidatus Riflebacteria bacterium]|nr:hypothetical protein [Candidatus Riflebacteria bacterium]